jgi:eukaryotic-like serine/threonine-protein kinase
MQDPLVGREVDGRYLIESRIAHGGMANVYLALDRRLDREVALKVLYEHLSTDEEFVSRFVREARAAARLSHPNAVQVFDQGSDGPVLYLAMEYLPGRTLRDVLVQRGALTPREAVSVMEPVLGALAAAHRAGIVHRDVKPENVILTDDGRIKVADFGLARAVTAPMTGNGQLIGTVAYLAPELVSRGVADARADVYAAGIMLFELLTGKQPFTGDDPLQVAYRHVHEDVPTPSAVSVGVTTEYDELVARATNRDPDERPADADAFLTELRAVTATVPDEVLDLRAAQAPVRDAATVVAGAPAPAAQPQATRALSLDDAPSRRGPAATSSAGLAGLSQLIPRLRVHDDDEPAPGVLAVLSDPRNRAAVYGTIGATVLVLLLIVVWYNKSGPGAYIKTPPLISATVQDAQQTLQQAGLTWTISQVFDDSVPKGRVISTDPGPGKDVRKNGSVALTVSKGRDVIVIPDLRGKTLEEARTLLASNRLELGEPKEKYSATVPKDQIIGSSPVQGNEADPGTKITVTVSLGEELVPLPNVVGQNVNTAKKALEDLGFTVTVVEQDLSFGQLPGTVVGQDPQAQNQSLPKGSTVTLSAIKQLELREIPDVRGDDKDEARAELEALGFKVSFSPPFFGGNKVRDQSLYGQAPVGTEVTLFLRGD